YDPGEATYRGDDPYRGEDPNDFWGEPPPASDPPPPPPAEARPASRRWPLLPAALQALGWWIRSRPARAPARAALGLGALAALAAAGVARRAGRVVVAAGGARGLRGMAGIKPQGHCPPIGPETPGHASSPLARRAGEGGVSEAGRRRPYRPPQGVEPNLP